MSLLRCVHNFSLRQRRMFFADLYLFRDVFRMCSASSAPTVSCPTQWTVYPESGVFGSKIVTEVSTQQRCLEACAADQNCVSVDWDTNKARHTCWTARDRLDISSRGGITHFEVVRRYNTASGASHYSVPATYCRTISSHLTSGGSSPQKLKGLVPAASASGCTSSGVHGADPGILQKGRVREYGHGSPPVGSSVNALVGDLGTKSPRN